LYTYDADNDRYDITGGDANQLMNIWYSSVEENMYRGQINYTNSFGAHSLSAMVVAEATQRKNPAMQIEGTPVTNALSLLKTDEFSWLDDRYGETARAGIATRFNYSYADKYIVEFSGRYDGSYKFLPEDRWGFFPSILAAYRVSEEGFWKNAGLDSYISNFKLRGSYGVLGDDGIVGDFDYYDGYNYGSGKYVMNPNSVTNGIQQRGMPNTNMTWLEVKTFNVGVDVGVFDNKLNLAADYFTRTRSGWPATKNDVVIPSEMGFSLPRENLNEDKDIGWDASVSYTDKAGAFSYDVGFNIGFSRRKTSYLYNPQFSNSIHEWRANGVDRWQNIDWGYLSDGQFQSQEQIDNHPVDNDGRGNTRMRPGDIIYKDLNGDGKITWSEDSRPIGYGGGLPLLNYGITANLSWKGFDMFMLWQGAGRYKYYRDWEIQKPMPGDGNSPAFFTDRWHRADLFDPNSEWIPGKLPSTGSWSVGENNNYDKRSDFWMINVNYIRLKNFELGYNLPKSYANKIALNGLRVYFSGTNLLTFDNVDVVDPELSRTNAVSYPSVKTYNIGVKVTL
jgi:TonB-linked SusC/RagA family outer membrane protein